MWTKDHLGPGGNRTLGFVMLEDDKHYFPPYEAVPEAVEGAFVDAVHLVIGNGGVPFEEDIRELKLFRDKDTVPQNTEGIDLYYLDLLNHLWHVMRGPARLIEADNSHIRGRNRTQDGW